MSVPNQKVVYIHKRKYTGNFLQIGIDEMRLAQPEMPTVSNWNSASKHLKIPQGIKRQRIIMR